MIPTEHRAADSTPLTTDAQIEARVRALVGRAVSRQLWLFLLDGDDVQLPVLMPVSGIPVSPGERDLEQWTTFVAGVVPSTGARSLVAVLERYAPDRLGDADRAWARLMRDGTIAAGVTLRAVVLSHSRGVRLLAEEDYA